MATRKLKVGDRVEYIGSVDWFRPGDSRMGTVVKLYPGHDCEFDDDDNVISSRALPYPEEWRATVRVDKRPAGWPYGDRDKFAPEVTELRKERSK